ncbi:MAG: hypothetical protein IT257_09465 [Chitinophagaceae bacterium]|nr:hypothetical protein [Chitinophagaceae bacterium]
MKANYLLLIILSLLSCTLGGCEVVEGIFKAGVWSGVLMVVLLVALLIFIFTRIGKGKN